MVADLLLVDVELLEDGLVEQAALFVITASVEILRILEQLEAQLDQASGDGQFLVGLAEASLKALPLSFNLPQLLLDLVQRDRVVAIGHQVDQIRFLGVEAAEFRRELPVEELGGGCIVLQRLGDVPSDVGNEVWRELNGGVVGFNCLFHVNDVDVSTVAVAALLGTTEKIGVLGAACVDGVLDDHPRCDSNTMT